MPEDVFTVSGFLGQCNDNLYREFSDIAIKGEVSSYKESQGKWVFFDLKDEESSIGCFMPLWELRVPLEDGMKIVVSGTPKITAWGKFSFTVKNIRPAGKGSIKKAFEMLKKKLKAEGLFDLDKKRDIPSPLTRIGVISSTDAAGYADFVKILNARWGGLDVQVAHTQVQGLSAPDQIIRALKFFNEKAEVQMIAILRGGGSADDLAAFNDEQLVRAIVASRIPVITGIGHEVDESLADLAADVRASTPSNVAEILAPDRQAILRQIQGQTQQIRGITMQAISNISLDNTDKIEQIRQKIYDCVDSTKQHLLHQQQILQSFDPNQVLKRGYAIMTGRATVGNVVKITTYDKLIQAEVKNVTKHN